MPERRRIDVEGDVVEQSVKIARFLTDEAEDEEQPDDDQDYVGDTSPPDQTQS